MDRLMNKQITNEEWYTHLVEECKAIITEATFNSRWALVEGYWNLGKRIREDSLAQEFAKGNKTFVQDLARNLNTADRTIYYALQAYDKYPDLNEIPEGKNISWNKLITQYLPAQKEHIAPLPENQYRVIYADPPWEYDNSGFAMSAEKQYPTLSTDKIKQLPAADLGADTSILFLWATNPLLQDALEVMRSWGYEYKTNLVWVKKNHTAGFYVFGQHELLLIGTRGSILPEGTKTKSVITGENSVHSKKPEVVYEIIEKMYPNANYIELFARNKRDGWESWGNEL